MTRRQILLACFMLLQIATFLTILVVVGTDFRRFNPWPIITLFGILLGQCSLAAAFAVFSPWKLSIRMACSALLVVGGGSAILLADSPGPRREDFLLVILFALLMWLLNQLPLWLCRLLLHARATTDEVADTKTTRSQYGIRQLMALTLAVSLILGIARMVLPQQAFEELKDIKVVDWVAFTTISIGVALIVSTTILAVLNPHFLRAGLAVSAVSAALVAYGTYSIFGVLGAGPPSERIHFAYMLICTYVWVQLSILLLRAAGYRVVVGK